MKKSYKKAEEIRKEMEERVKKEQEEAEQLLENI